MIRQAHRAHARLIKKTICVLGLTSGALFLAPAQPTADPAGVRFRFVDAKAHSVTVAGDFNSWSKDDSPLVRDSAGNWTVVVQISPGAYQYKFVVDGVAYVNDPANPALVPNFNSTAINNVFVLSEDRRVLLSASLPQTTINPHDIYPAAPGKKPVYLNIIWHQHQPLYTNPATDQLSGPWVRTHATKDYYDMAAMLTKYPAVHCTINLTSSLLIQLREYYLKRLGPYIDLRRGSMDVPGFLAQWRGKTDPWIDLALTDASQYDSKDKDFLYRNAWNAFSTSEVQMSRFPEYRALKDRCASGTPDNLFSAAELQEIIFWFYLSQFDPDFLLGPVKLADGSVCDLSTYLEFRRDSTFHLKKSITKADCTRMVIEAYKVMANVIPVHRALAYDPESGSGQIELITTPYTHPILPLIYDTDLTRICQPNDSLPSRYTFPQDAEAQVAKAVVLYREIFGRQPRGMWPGEGAVAQPVLRVFRDNGIEWSASDAKILARSDPPSMPNTAVYRFPAGESRWLSLVFRDTELSDRIGFKYQNYTGEEAAEDFVRSVLDRASRTDEPDVLLTVILDGENAWEYYRRDIDGKQFLNAFYRKLTHLHYAGRVITVTTSEYIQGNRRRSVPPHPVADQTVMKSVWPGSWINANYDTWIGEREENLAWEYLLRARSDLGHSGLAQPDPHAPRPMRNSQAYFAYMAWEELYAAEGSDWFWWYGDDQTAPGGDKPFDTAYLIHLENIYAFARKAGSTIVSPKFSPIITDIAPPAATQGVMAQSSGDKQTLIFTCDARSVNVSKAIYIVGNLPALGNWAPNTVMMHDDGQGGDETPGDGIWTYRTEVPAGIEIQYKYTNSGAPGQWVPGEEFPVRHRTITIATVTPAARVITDTFGK
ncbi:MAG TPA: carbohydrate-binding module family 20 domain-containing protein [Bacteroidota bacterium]|nr:carbohydrate-binding module family 20 domain-containing protein [Bacteroidota bacterium]